MSSVPTNYEGPVCNLNSKVAIAQPIRPTLPTIPVATDLPSALSALNGLRQIVMQIMNQLPQGNNSSSGGSQNPNNAADKTDQGQQGGSFHEVPGSRQTKTVKVSNPDDSSQFVMVEQVTSVTFKNSIGNTLIYKNQP